MKLACTLIALSLVPGALFGGMAMSTLSSAGDNVVRWPQFRGPDVLPVSDNPNLPSRWSREENVEWVAEVPGTGWSSPIAWGEKVFLTSAVSEQAMKQPSLGVDFSNDYIAELMEQGKTEDEALALLTARDLELPNEVMLTYHLFCFDLATGEQLWDRAFYHGAPPVGRHRKNSFASETPISDGEAVYVYVGHLGLFAFDLSGKQLWYAPVAAHQVYLDFGSGASPALSGNRLFILNDNEEEGFVAAYDKRTGERLWYTTRPDVGAGGRSSGWSTPFVWTNALRTELVTIGPGVAISYDLEGKELWRFPEMAATTIQTPFAWDGLLYLTSGSSPERIKPIAAIRPGAEGVLHTASKGAQGDGAAAKASQAIAWYNAGAGGTYLPTPLIYGGRLYVLTDKGILDQYDAKTGERIYRTRIHREARNFTASPWAYDGKVFALNEEGTTYVIRAGEEFELLGVNRLDEFSMATPALVGDRLLIRTQDRLYSIREQGGSSSAAE